MSNEIAMEPAELLGHIVGALAYVAECPTNDSVSGLKKALGEYQDLWIRRRSETQADEDGVVLVPKTDDEERVCEVLRAVRSGLSGDQPELGMALDRLVTVHRKVVVEVALSGGEK